MRAGPVVQRVCEAEGQRLLICDVGDRAAYRKPDHPARTAPWGLTCIPTLVGVSGGWTGLPRSRLASELEKASADEGAVEELVETFVREQRLGILGAPDLGADDERAIPIRPDKRRVSGGSGGIVDVAPGPSDYSEARPFPVAQASAGIVAVWITAGMLLVVMHEHHHHTHNVPNGIERNAEYFLYSILYFAPILVLVLFGYFRNRHFNQVAALKNL